MNNVVENTPKWAVPENVMRDTMFGERTAGICVHCGNFFEDCFCPTENESCCFCESDSIFDLNTAFQKGYIVIGGITDQSNIMSRRNREIYK